MIDVSNIKAKVIAALRADAAVQTALGAAPNTRVYERVPHSLDTWPFCRMEQIGGIPGASTKADWIRTLTLQFSTFSKSTSEVSVAAAQKAIADVMDAARTGITLTSGAILESFAKIDFIEWLAEFGSMRAVNVHELWIDPT